MVLNRRSLKTNLNSLERYNYSKLATSNSGIGYLSKLAYSKCICPAGPPNHPTRMPGPGHPLLHRQLASPHPT